MKRFSTIQIPPILAVVGILVALFAGALLRAAVNSLWLQPAEQLVVSLRDQPINIAQIQAVCQPLQSGGCDDMHFDQQPNLYTVSYSTGELGQCAQFTIQQAGLVISRSDGGHRTTHHPSPMTVTGCNIWFSSKSSEVYLDLRDQPLTPEVLQDHCAQKQLHACKLTNFKQVDTYTIRYEYPMPANGQCPDFGFWETGVLIDVDMGDRHEIMNSPIVTRRLCGVVTFTTRATAYVDPLINSFAEFAIWPELVQSWCRMGPDSYFAGCNLSNFRQGDNQFHIVYEYSLSQENERCPEFEGHNGVFVKTAGEGWMLDHSLSAYGIPAVDKTCKVEWKTQKNSLN